MSDSDSFRIKRSVIKETPNRMTMRWFCGVFILISSVFVGVGLGHMIFGIADDAMAYWFGMFFTLLIGGVVGWFTIVLQENAQNIQIRVVQQK
jgi:hypothetical protein